MAKFRIFLSTFSVQASWKLICIGYLFLTFVYIFCTYLCVNGCVFTFACFYISVLCVCVGGVFRLNVSLYSLSWHQSECVCGVDPLPTMKPFTKPGAFYQYAHTDMHTCTFSEISRGRWMGFCLDLEKDEGSQCVCLCGAFCIRV